MDKNKEQGSAIMKRIWISLALVAGLAVAASAAQAQDFKTRQVRIVVPTGAGTIADVVARVMAKELSERLNQTFFVEDRVGANGIVAARAVASSPPDGTTFIVGNVSTHAANEFLFKKLDYDPQKDFVPVALVGSIPQVLVVSNELPAKTFADFVKLAKEKPGKLNFASASSLTIVAMDAITHAAGIETVHVPFGATPQALNEMMAGRVDAMVADLGVTKALIDAGKIRPILTTMSERSPLLPDVPAFPDVGLPKYDFEGWFGWYAPKGTPPEAIERVTKALHDAAMTKENKENLAKYGVFLIGGGPAELEKFVAGQRAMYRDLIKQAGIEMQ
jgi:tripartite-type tricarboxylate transporter receptor subunit TctC